jgi:hypothetical protein
VTATLYKQACKEFYLHFKQKGKASKLALVAVANKQLLQVFAVVKQVKDYLDGYISK